MVTYVYFSHGINAEQKRFREFRGCIYLDFPNQSIFFLPETAYFQLYANEFIGAFDFRLLLGALSLIGLLIKNAIVLIEEIEQQIAEGKAQLTAIPYSATSCLL